ncbi:MAG: SpoIIIAH-like family protein [Ruminococcaceae bacterium]|nr:SpoIIIAH-like family protein [Oscillospiraceae bacterium]
MKKGNVFSKSQLVLAGLIVALGAAVFINMKFAANDTVKGDLGSGNYVAGSSQLGAAVEAGANVSTLNTAREELSKKREELMSALSNTANSGEENDDIRKNAVDQLGALTDSMNREANIETIIKAKGIADALVIISEDSVTVMVQSEKLLQSQTLQIQDAVISQTGVDLEKIKIITMA